MATPPHITVAAVAARDRRFLTVEEEVDGRRVYNQPAGHWEPGESLVEAVVRETREETALRFVPQALVGVYQWTRPGGETFLRFCFCGRVEGGGEAPLDPDIRAVHWLSRAQLAARPLRSPMVLRCLDDYLAGRRCPLDRLQVLP